MLYCSACLPMSICWYFESAEVTSSIWGFNVFHRIFVDNASILSVMGENQTVIMNNVKPMETNPKTLVVFLFSFTLERKGKKVKRANIPTFKSAMILNG